MKLNKFVASSWLLLAAVGCNSSSKETATANPSESKAAASNIAQAQTTPQPVVTNGAGTEPGEIVALFLDSLRRGDENAANGVLTAQAQSELAKTDYVIQPLGTPEGVYKIGRVGYVDGDTTVGLVECLWTEPSPEAGQPAIELDIVCEVRKEPQGWRISGLAVKMSGTEETVVLDFENAVSLQQALEQAGGKPVESASASAGTVARASATQEFATPPGPQSLPTQTEFSNQLPSEFAPNQFPTQIALPPSDESINR